MSDSLLRAAPLALALALSACADAQSPLALIPTGPPDVVLERPAPRADLADRLVIATSPVIEWRANAWRVAR